MTPPRLRVRTLRRRLRTRWPLALLCVVLLAAVVTVVVQLAGSRAATDRPIRVASGSWAPYVDPALPGGGPVAQLVTEVLNRAGYAPEVDYTSWQLAEDRVASGASIAVFPLVASSQRREDFLLSEPLLEFEYALFQRDDESTSRLTDPQDLATLKVGGVAGYDYWPELEQAAEVITRYDTSLEAFQALAAGEIDLLAEGLLSGRAVLADPKFNGDSGDFDVVQGDAPWLSSTEGLHLMVPRTEAAGELLAAFDQALGELRGTDTYAQLVAGIEPGTTSAVLLEPVGATRVVELLERDGSLAFLAPRGTRAQVLAWPEAFTENRSRGRRGWPDVPLVHVKLTNGPGQGRVAWVAADSLTLDGTP